MRTSVRMLRDMDYRQQLIALVDAYGEATHRSESRVGRIAANQGLFFRKIRAGAGCTIDKYLAVKAWFAAAWPADLPWPDGVDRPGVLPERPELAGHDAAPEKAA